jgi:hypothetical protein
MTVRRGGYRTATMTAESGSLGDCAHCQSAGSVRAGRCEICEWEATPPRPARVETDASTGRDEGTFTTAAG